MILVTGATGNVGTEVVKQLAAGSHKVRALVRDMRQAAARFPTTVDLVMGDLDNIESLVNAMKGVDRLYMLAPLTPSLVRQEANLVEAARRAKLQHVVKHSVLGAQWETMTLGRWHRTGEKAVEASGIAWTHVRPNAFFSSALWFAGMIRRGGTVYYPTGDGKVGVVDPRDVAAVAVKALTEPGHERKCYEVTGPRALNTQEQVDIIGKAIGKPLEFVDVPDQSARETMLGQGMSAALVEAMLEFTSAVRDGEYSVVTDTVLKVTRKAPRTFEAWAKDNAAAFK